MMCGCREARGAAEVAVAGDRGIIRTARFVIMIAMLMTKLLLQLKVLNGYSRRGAVTRKVSERRRQDGIVSAVAL